MMESLSVFRPVISRSIQMRFSFFAIRRCAIRQPKERRPESACARVPPSTYSSPPPTGPARERGRGGSPIHILKLAAHGHAMRDAARAHAEGACNLAQEMRGRFTFDGGIGRKNEFAYVAPGEDRAS